MPLLEPDEARYSDISSLMNRTGDYVTPRLNHVVYLEKPPLCYWATALAYKLFGENEFSSRLFVALCAWGCLLLVYRMGAFFHNEKAGLYSAGVLGTCLFFSFLGKTNILDIPLALFMSLATWTGYRYFAGGGERKRWLYLLYLNCGLAFLTKGLIGIVFPFAILVLWLSLSRRWRDLLRLFSPVGIVIFLVISCPWIILVQKANKDFLWFFFIQEHFLRYTTTLHHRNHFFLIYVPIVLFGTLPWSAFLWKALKEGVKEKVPLFKKAEIRFLLVWILFIFVFFSMSSSKLLPYIAPLFLPIAVIFGRVFSLYDARNIPPEEGRGRRLLYNLPVILQSSILIALFVLPLFIKKLRLGEYLETSHVERWCGWLILSVSFLVLMIFLPGLVKKRWKRGWFLTVTLLSALFLFSIHFPIKYILVSYRSAYDVSKAIRMLVPPGHELFQFGTNLYGIDFYNKIRTPLVGHGGELEYGLFKLPPDERPRYYMSIKEFLGRCKEENDDIYCVTRYKDGVEIIRGLVPTMEILWNNGVFYLLRVHC